MPRLPTYTRGEIIAALHAHGGDITAAAATLGAHRQTLAGRIRRDRLIRDARRAAKRAKAEVEPCPHCGGTGVTLI